MRIYPHTSTQRKQVSSETHLLALRAGMNLPAARLRIAGITSVFCWPPQLADGGWITGAVHGDSRAAYDFVPDAPGLVTRYVSEGYPSLAYASGFQITGIVFPMILR